MLIMIIYIMRGKIAFEGGCVGGTNIIIEITLLKM